MITKFFYFKYIVRKLLHYTTVESTLLKSRTPYLINSLEMNPRRPNLDNLVHPDHTEFILYMEIDLFGNSFSESPLEGPIQHSTILLI